MHLAALVLATVSWSGHTLSQSPNVPEDLTCALIAQSISSSSSVYYPGNPLLGLLGLSESSVAYEKGIYHWAFSSTQRAKCVVEPGTPADVATILQILGSTRTPFAVKGGGHASNPGFSSTSGVHIAMGRFSEVTYDEGHQTAVVGAGLVWDNVYAALAPHRVSVLGGRVTGVGVAGFILGGGYSWKTNQHGLTVDTVVAFELVKSNGTVLQVTRDSDPDLFFGLKGGFNNFGIVTRFTLKTFPQTDVWGGLIMITAPYLNQLSAATAAFAANVTDPKAGIIATYNFLLGQPGVTLMLFYDEPNPPRGIFEKFLDIPFFRRDVKQRDIVSLVQSSPSNLTANKRGIFHTVSLTRFTPSILQEIVKECIYWGTQLNDQGTLNILKFISYDVEPFLSDIFSHNDSPSAYPSNRTVSYNPLNIYYAWSSESRDEAFHSAIRESATRIHASAFAEGQKIDDAPLYPNYAIFDTPLQRMYGSNLQELARLKRLHDPDNIMGLAGGFKF